MKIPTADLKILLLSKSTYKAIDEPKASLVELFDDFIVKQVKEEIETILLREIFLLMIVHEDDFFINLVESDLEEKISTANLEELLKAKSLYKSTGELKSDIDILRLLDDSITQQVKTASLDDLLDQRKYWDDIDDEIIESVLSSNASAVIDRFLTSESYNSAGSNSRLLVKIAEYLSPVQWENILESFFQNDQLYCSRSCYGGFEALFKSSLELSNSVQPYWITFREKLNKFNTEHSNSLKRLIDSHG